MKHFLDVFFDESLSISDEKQTMLRRMLMGMTSYYPINKSKVGTMPTIVKPTLISEKYKNYSITNDINIVLCPMTNVQFEKYYISWSDEKMKEEIRKMKALFSDDEDELNDYNIRTRQNSNIVYIDDDFRFLKNEERKRSYKTSDL